MDLYSTFIKTHPKGTQARITQFYLQTAPCVPNSSTNRLSCSSVLTSHCSTYRHLTATSAIPYQLTDYVHHDDDDGDDDDDVARHLHHDCVKHKHASPAGVLVMGRDQRNSPAKWWTSDWIQKDLTNRRLSDTVTSQTPNHSQLQSASIEHCTQSTRWPLPDSTNSLIFTPLFPVAC